ncbi:hypothetical protein OROGR_026851 [Orobanche gracilis]
MEKEETTDGSSEVLANQQVTRLPDGVGGQEDENAVSGNEPGESEPSERRKEILKALEAMERDSVSIAESYSRLFASLRLSLSQVWDFSVDVLGIGYIFIQFGFSLPSDYVIPRPPALQLIT